MSRAWKTNTNSYNLFHVPSMGGTSSLNFSGSDDSFSVFIMALFLYPLKSYLRINGKRLVPRQVIL